MNFSFSTNSFTFFKGRVALYAILRAIGIKQGDEVILPGFTCVVVPNAIIYLGAKPVYVDINPDTFNIDVAKIEEKITKKTRAIIAQHTFGIPADMDKILKVAKKYNMFVIEDSCHALGAKYKDKEVGSFGDAAFFSSQWSKPLTTGLGGFAIINNLELKERLNEIYPQFSSPSLKEVFLLRLQYLVYSKLFKPSRFWLIQDTYRKLSRFNITIGSSSNEELESKMPYGYEKKMSKWQRDALEKKLIEIEKYIKYRKSLAYMYEKHLGLMGFKTAVLPKDYEPVFLRYPVMVKNKKKVLSEAKKRCIEIGDWFVSPIHPSLNGWEKIGYQKGICPIAEEICEHIINLPTHDKISETDALKIIDFVTNKIRGNTIPYHVRNQSVYR